MNGTPLAAKDFLRMLGEAVLVGFGTALGLTVLTLTFLWLTASPAAASERPVTRGELRLQSDAGVTAPLLATDVLIKVTGPLARVRVRQTFKNPGTTWAEGVYLFPLPPQAAVDRLRMRVGERIIEGKIKEKNAAKKIYETAKKQGKRTSLVENRTSNLFTTSVANIPPQSEIIVEIDYQEKPRWDAGAFSLRFPLVAAPRYGHPLEEEVRSPAAARIIVERLTGSEEGWVPQGDATTEVKKLLPPRIAPPDTGTNRVSLTVELESGFPLEKIASAYHPVTIKESASGRHEIKLRRETVPADRDFELTWRPQTGAEPRAALFRQSIHGKEYALVMALPPKAGAIRPGPRDVTFILDVSGSMGGEPIAQAKQALIYALRRLAPRDRFNVIAFNQTAHALLPGPVPALPEIVDGTIRRIDELQAMGGTEMAAALEMALGGAGKRPDGRVRQVVFLTDGNVANEVGLFRLIREKLGDRRLFPVGIGSAPNANFMQGAAKWGRGSFIPIGDQHQIAARMGLLTDKIQRPALTAIRIDAGEGAEILPERIPDLYAGEPLSIVLRADVLPSSLRISGRMGDANWESELVLPARDDRPGLSVLWARRQIADWMERRILGDDPESIRKNITRIALEHHLVSRYTSLVAVDDAPVRPPGADLATSNLPLNTPYGWKAPSLQPGQGATPAGWRLLTGFALVLTAMLGLAGRRLA